MAITNSQQARQMYNQGGYADMGLQAPRQNYGLGKFVKKAIRGVKKIVKSPLGKAALIGAGGFYLGGGNLLGLQRAGATGFGQGIFNKGIAGAIRGGLGNFRGGVKDTKMGGLSNLFRQSIKGDDGKYTTQGSPFSLGKLALGGLGAASLAPLLMGDKDDGDDGPIDQINPSNITNRARNY